MNRTQIAIVTEDRIGRGRWAKHFIESHSTPLICIGVSHGHEAGNLCITCVEDLSNAELAALLKGAAAILESEPPSPGSTASIIASQKGR